MKTSFNLFLSTFLFLFIQSCKSDQTDELIIINGFIENGSITDLQLKTNLKFKFHNQSDTILRLTYNKKKFQNSLKIKEGYYDLLINDKIILLYLKKGFELNLDIQFDNVSITGNGSNENQYLQSRDNLDKELAYKNTSNYYSQLKEENFLKLVDSIYNLRIDLLTNLNNQKFKFLEESFAKLDKSHKYINYPFRRLFFDSSYVTNKKFLTPFEHININDERLIDSPYYLTLMFLKTVNEIIARDINPRNNDMSFEYLKYVISDSLNVSNFSLKESIVYNTANITIQNTNHLDDFFKTYTTFTKNEAYLNNITKKYYHLKGFSKGSKAPNFKISDKEGNFTTLESLKGNVIYIDFWASWCKPCLAEIEPSNQLQKKLNKEAIKFVNICIETDFDNWIKIVDKKNIQGINLFADKIAQLKLKENFLLQGLPRYIIIDKNGFIFDFSSKRPSNPKLEKELMTIL